MSLTDVKRTTNRSEFTDSSSKDKGGVSFGDLIKKELDQHNDDD